MKKKITITISVLIVLIILGYSFAGENSLTTQEIPGLPPDPGEAGKATLEGIDSDGDGVRDDIQRYIALTYPDEPLTRLGLRQYARALQNATIHSDDAPGAYDRAVQINDAQRCVWALRGIDTNVEVLVDARMLNTEDRSRAYLEHDQSLGGNSFSGLPLYQWRLHCEFRVEKSDTFGGGE